MASQAGRYKPPVVSVVFGAGRLGIKIHSEDGSAPVRVKAFIPEQDTGMPPSVQRSGLIAVGDVILSVNDGSVVGEDYSVVLGKIRASRRPLTLRFAASEGVSTASGETATVDLTRGNDPVVTYSRLAAYRRCLDSGVVDLAELRRLAFQGVPEERRSVVWQLLLNYLPPDTAQWQPTRDKMRELYRGYKRDFLIGPPTALGGMALLELTEPPLPEASAHHADEGARLMADLLAASAEGADATGAGSGSSGSRRGSAAAQTPRGEAADGIEGDWMRAPMWFAKSPRLRFFPSVVPGQNVEDATPEDAEIRSPDARQMWKNHYVEASAMSEIEKDVLRTHPGLHFFNRDTQQRLADMLYVYAKLNPGACVLDDQSVARENARLHSLTLAPSPSLLLSMHATFAHSTGISYVQGMNELLAPLYYAIAQDLGEGREEEAEADTFYCFTNLMSEVRSLYVKDMDKEEKGIYGSMRALTALIDEIDPEIGEHLLSIGVCPEFYAFRWLTTLGSREFDLPVRLLPIGIPYCTAPLRHLEKSCVGV